MAIKPMLFNTEMVRAILSGQKTCTRRVVKPRYKEDEGGFQINTNVKTGERWVEKSDWDEGSFDPPRYVNPPCRPGDILYVRETWNGIALGNAKVGYTDLYWYKADDESQNPADKWRPSIHMPKEAARIFLRVTDVRVERLQDCGNMQAKDEGCTCCSQFARVWDSTIKPADIGRYGWATNPWVWVIEFERISKEAALGGGGDG